MMTMMTVKETADFFGVSPRTVFRWIKSGKLESVKIGGIVRIKGEEIERVINEGSKKDA